MELEKIYDTLEGVKGHIYKITCEKTNKVYVGQTYSHIKNHGKYRPAGYLKRFAGHISEAVTNTKQKQCTYLNNAIRKYGKESFKCELIFECELDELDEYEQMCIKEYNSLYPTGYNLTNGGKGAFYVAKVKNEDASDKPEELYKHSDTTKAKIKQRLKDILSSEVKRQERSEKCKLQHMKARLDKYKNIIIDDDITKYIYPIIKKGTTTVYKYEVKINGIMTAFFDNGKSDITILYANAVDFLNKLKEQNNNV